MFLHSLHFFFFYTQIVLKQKYPELICQEVDNLLLRTTNTFKQADYFAYKFAYDEKGVRKQTLAMRADLNISGPVLKKDVLKYE